MIVESYSYHDVQHGTKYRWLSHKEYSQKSQTDITFTVVHQVVQVYIAPTLYDAMKINRSETMIIGPSSLLEDVIKHLVHVGTVEVRHGNLWLRRDRQAHTLVAYPRHGATPR